MAEPDTTPSDPETVLQALREHAAEETAEADALTADVKSLTEAIAALTKSRDDIAKADLAYQKADHPKAIAAIEDYGEQKRACVDSSLGDRLEAAERLVREFTAEVDTVAEQLETAGTELREAQQDAAAKTKTLADASARFAARLALPDSLKPPVDALAKLQTDLKAAIDGSDHFGAFAIDRELLRAAGVLDPPALTEYRGLLVAGWNAVATAQQDARDAGKTVASRQGDVDKLTLRLAALTADRVAELRRRWAAQAG
jgi:prefoldin subunit 5